MFRIIDRYIIREVLAPMGLSLLLLTFILSVPPILRQAEELIVKGIAWTTFLHALILLLPSSLSLTIPMSVLLGILIGFGKLSADREFVAMQACGVSPFRLIRPVACIALVGALATAHQIIVALPDANQTYREIVFNVIANRAESNVKPRIFYTEFPSRTIYAREVTSSGWKEVFLADTYEEGRTTLYLAQTGRLLVDRAKRTVSLELTDGTRHTTSAAKPDEYEGADYDRVLIHLDPNTVFSSITPTKTPTEMSIAELRESIAAAAKNGDSANAQRYTIQLKFAIPTAALVLALIGLGLGVSHRKDGRLASFVLGFGVIFAYYVVLWTFRAAGHTGRVPPGLAPWVPNVIFGAAGIALVFWRAGSADRPIRIGIPTFWRHHSTTTTVAGTGDTPRRNRVVLVIRVPHLNLPRPALLDLYVSSQYLRIFFLGLVSLLGVFYISTFMDLADKLFRGTATTSLILQYFFYQTPQYVVYVIPIAALVATLVTIGLLTKSSELVVMRACGISLYRTAAPLLLFGAAASAVLFGLQEQVIAYSNREADRLNRLIRGYPPASFGALDRRWMIGENGNVYHYDLFDSAKNEFHQFTVYQVDPARWDLRAVTRATRVALTPSDGTDGQRTWGWVATDGWSRDILRTTKNDVTKTVVSYSPFSNRPLSLEPPSYFKNDQPIADLMTYSQLKRYVAQLQVGGYDVMRYMVELQRKIAFPFVTIVLTLLAVPFAVTTGSRGALYGVGAAIILAIVYWLLVSVCAALGAGGLLPPMLAAWTPNILFTAAAAYLILTVRT
ncbi:MAG TPA: LptF/LptG family permease [Vicinamibacterales bacterium]|jgi:LPS export ABC transporter permease LptF/LPS export ABC transporter permease LptG|nr:LptF/LptG family permease [Vicinamibacterales bacterium]